MLILPLVVMVIIAVALAALRDLDIATRRSAIVDELTGVLNRSALAPRVAELAHHAARTGARVAVDRGRRRPLQGDQRHGGHADRRRRAARGGAAPLALRRDADESIYRYGGEEFVVLLAGADAAGGPADGRAHARAIREQSIAGAAT